MKENTFLKGTIILTLSSLAVKFLSAVYRIPLTRMIGAVGMGHYSAAFNMFLPFYSLATAGITPTVSRLSAACQPGDLPALVSVKKAAARCFSVTSVIMIILALVFSGVYSYYNSSPMIFIGVGLLCPNLFLATFEAIYKGVSQGSMNMAVTAKANVLESGAKVVIGLSSVYVAGRLFIKDAASRQAVCAFATVSICGYICWRYMKNDFINNYPVRRQSGHTVRTSQLLSMAVPISLSALAVSAAGFFDTAVCLSIVKKLPDSALIAAYPGINFSGEKEKAMWLYGVYQGLCLSVAGLIPSLAASLGTSSLPLITKSVQSGNKNTVRRQTDKLIKITASRVVPISMFVAFFPSQMLTVLYGDRGSRITLASRFLKICAVTAVFSSFTFPMNSILHAVGRSGSILRILLISCAVKMVTGGVLCSVPGINIKGCIYSQLIFQIMVYILSVIRVKKESPQTKITGRIFVPLALSYITLSAVKAVADLLIFNYHVLIYTVLCGVCFVLIYRVLLWRMGFFVDKETIK